MAAGIATTTRTTTWDRFRLSITSDDADAKASSCRQRSSDATTETAPRALWREAPGRFVATCSCASASKVRRDAHSRARRLSEARQRTVTPWRTRVPASPSEGCSRRPADVRAAGWSTAVSHDGASHRESRLAGLFRSRASCHQRGPGQAERAAVASRIARLARSRVHGARLELEALHRLIVTSATYRQSSHGHTRSCSHGSVQSPAGASAEAPGGSRNRARHRTGRQRSLEPESRRPERVSAGAGFPVPTTRRATARRSGTKTRARIVIGALCTLSGSARCLIRCCRLSTRRTATCPACGAPIQHAVAGADDVE